eukprot:1853047-Rhodomonas_salina.1
MGHVRQYQGTSVLAGGSGRANNPHPSPLHGSSGRRLWGSTGIITTLVLHAISSDENAVEIEMD